MVYCDSSFLVALSVPDAFTGKARRMAAGFSDPIPLVLIGELELFHRVHSAVGENRLSVKEHFSVIRQIEEDLADGILVRKNLHPREHLNEALRLSRKFASKLPCRSLDILHVAAALQMKYEHFASFDRRQRELASTAGLRLLPVKLS